MAEQPDLSLPDRIPEMEQYQESPEQILPFALYTMYNLTEEKKEAYRHLCQTGCNDDDEDDDREVVKFPPRSDFSDDTLRSIVKYHVTLGSDSGFDATYFIVAVFADSSAVVLVTLDDDDLECKPDLLWINIDESGLTAVNLQIANTDWGEAKEGDLEGPQYPPSGNDDEDNASDDAAGSKHQWPDDVSEEADYGPQPPGGPHIQLYAVSGVDEDQISTKIEPGSEYKKADRSDYDCKFHRLPTSNTVGAVKQAAEMHPYRCAQHPTLEKHYFLVADRTDFLEEGVELVRIDWDAQISGRTKNELLQVGRTATLQTQRAEVPENADRAAVGLLCMIAQGYQKWTLSHKQFAIYGADSADSDINLAKAVDPRWSKRGHGEDRVALGGSMTAEEIKQGDGFWPTIVRRHIAHCKRLRFVPNLVWSYFIWCGGLAPKGTSEIQLVKLEWDGDLRAAQNSLDDLVDTISVAESVASGAHKILTGIVDGKVVWSGVAPDP